METVVLDWNKLASVLFNYEIAGVLIFVTIAVLYKYFNAKINKNAKSESDVISTLIQQNQNLIKFVMDANESMNSKLQEAIDGLKNAVDKIVENKEISNHHFLLITRQIIRLAKFRIQEKLNRIVEKNSIVENMEVIMVEIDNIINSDLETIKNDMFSTNLNKNGYNEVISIINKHRDEFASLVKAEFAYINGKYDKEIMNRKIEGVLNESLREMFDKIEVLLK